MNTVFQDLDGTLTGLQPNSWATYRYKWNHHKECQYLLDVYDGVICDNTSQIRRVVFHAGEPDYLFKG